MTFACLPLSDEFERHKFVQADNIYIRVRAIESFGRYFGDISYIDTLGKRHLIHMNIEKLKPLLEIWM